MDALVIVVITIIVGLQTFVFCKNLLRMKEFMSIFSNGDSWMLLRDSDSGFVKGIAGDGNGIFRAICSSINEYMSGNTGAVIDYNLLKDAVDRHCDSVENDIATQTPVPLYLGLVGTMAGVIIGLWALLDSGSVITMLSGSNEAAGQNAGQVAGGINDLLQGVAWAMVASICGILLTTVSSYLFKQGKLKEEEGRNSFLAWMQSRLLPALPSDVTDSMNRLVANLNRFNNTFASNTENLRNTLGEVNQAASHLRQMSRNILDMDVMKMAAANVKVLEQLEGCTGQLQRFNDYLLSVEGYTDAIHRFEEQFQQEADRVHVLEEIKEFFAAHKGSMSMIVAEMDSALQNALGELADSATRNTAEIKSQLTEMSVGFKGMLEQEQEAFEVMARNMRAQFSDQLSQMPLLAKNLKEISDIPGKLDALVKTLENALRKARGSEPRLVTYTAPSGQIQQMPVRAARSMPGWLKWTLLAAAGVAIILLAADIVVRVISYNEMSAYFQHMMMP